jgi:hypothetical protein
LTCTSTQHTSVAYFQLGFSEATTIKHFLR